MEREFKGVWIPKEIWLDDNLTWSEKMLLVEIDSLSTLEKGCIATNEYLSSFFNLSKDRISKLISSLKAKGYIEVKLIYNGDTKQIIKREITTIGYRKKQKLDKYYGINFYFISAHHIRACLSQIWWVDTN